MANASKGFIPGGGFVSWIFAPGFYNKKALHALAAGPLECLCSGAGFTGVYCRASWRAVPHACCALPTGRGGEPCGCLRAAGYHRHSRAVPRCKDLKTVRCILLFSRRVLPWGGPLFHYPGSGIFSEEYNRIRRRQSRCSQCLSRRRR